MSPPLFGCFRQIVVLFIIVIDDATWRCRQTEWGSSFTTLIVSAIRDD